MIDLDKLSHHKKKYNLDKPGSDKEKYILCYVLQKNRPLEYTRKKIQVRRRRTRFVGMAPGAENVNNVGQGSSERTVAAATCVVATEQCVDGMLG